MAKGQGRPGAVAINIVANARGFTKPMIDAAKRAKKTQTAFQRLARFTKLLGRTFRAVLSPLARFARALKRMVFNLKSLIIGGVGIFAFVRFVKESVKLAATFDAAQFAMGNLLGSLQVAKKVMADIEQFTITTPFRFEELVEGARVLAGFGVRAEKLLPTLRALGDIAASVNTEIKPLVLGFGKALARNRVDIRILDIFFRRGIPLLPALAKVLGITTNEVLKAVTAGRVQFEHLEAAIATMTDKGTPFFNMMLELSKRTLGLWQSVVDTIQLFMRNFGQVLIDAFKLNTLMAAFIQFVQDNGERIGKMLGNTLAALGKLALKFAIAIERAGSVILGFTQPKDARRFVDGLKLILAGLAQFFAAQLGKAVLQLAPRLGKFIGLNELGVSITEQFAVMKLATGINFLKLAVPSSRLEGFAKLINEMSKDADLINRIFSSLGEVPTLRDAISQFGVGGGTGNVLTVAQQQLGDFVDKLREAIATSGLSAGQKLLRQLNGIAEGFKNASVNAKDYGLALKLILTQSITDAEKLLKATKTLASVPGVGAITPGTQESARLRFAAVNPLTKGVAKLISINARSLIEEAKTAKNTKDMADAITALGGLQAGHIP